MTNIPTDRPLTAGDVPLLREGDVLKVVRADAYMSKRAVNNGDLATFHASEEEPTLGIFISIKELPGAGMYPSRFTFVARPATSVASEGEGDEPWGWNREVCTGCSASLTIEEIKSRGCVSCCPDRRMVKVRDLVDAYEAALASPPSAASEGEGLKWPWSGDDPRHDEIRAAWEIYANEIVDDAGKIDLTDVDTCVSIGAMKALALAALASPPSERERELEGALRRLVDNHGAYIEALPGTSGVSDLETARSLLTAQPAGEPTHG